ncbi:hypothetical protein Tco_0688808 [Tanacetum coccineum]|uniref:Retrotransposon gag domain-containing protein n=1 Tax=Tanacetum coccineum TaxID=301880 RepID=A0ABQ5HKF7_9ASTR
MRYSREEQPLPAAASPTADSPGYVPESNPEEDDEDPEEDPADWERGRETSCLNHPTTITTYSTIISITTYTNLPYISWHRTTASPIRLRWALSGPADDRAERRGHHSNLHTISLPTFYHTLQYEIGESSAAACRLVDRLEVRVGQTMGLSVLWIPRSDDREPRRSAMGLEMFGVDRDQEKEFCSDIYAVIEDTQTGRNQIYIDVLETLFNDKIKILALRYVVMDVRMAVISQLLAADRKSQDYRLDAELSYRGQHGPAKKVRHKADAPGRLSFVLKMAPKRKTTRLNPDATPTPVIDTHTTTSVTNAQIQAMINEGVTAALAARDATRNGDDSHTSGTGARRPVQVARECTYPDFLKCQSLYFKSTEVKFATCTLQGNALTWWNSHVKTTTPEAAHAMPWRTLKKMMRQD